MSHVISSIGNIVKQVAPVALPLAASLIPGIGPLGLAAAGAAGGAIGGGGVRGALIDGGLSGLSGGLFGAAPGESGIGPLDSLNSGISSTLSPIGTSITGGISSALSPLRSLISGTPSADAGLSDTFNGIDGATAAPNAGISTGSTGGGNNAAIGNDSGVNLNNVGSNGLSVGNNSPVSTLNNSPVSAAFKDGFTTNYGDPTGLAFNDPTTAAVKSATNTGKSGNYLSSIFGGNPLTSASVLGQVAQVLNGGQKYKGTTTQAQTQAQIQSQQQAQQTLNQGFLNSLNAGQNTPLRTQLSPNTNYYTYGQRPEQQFFSNTSPISFQNPNTGTAQSLKAGGRPKINPNTGGAGGQDDSIKTNLSSGEFVIPADVTSGLGDGNNDAGANQLQNMIKNVRKQKTSKGSKGLPPPAKSPLQYMSGRV